MPKRIDGSNLPLQQEDMEWIEARWRWLVNIFGHERINSLPVILPTPAYFPDGYTGTQDCAQTMLNRIAHYMGVADGRVELMVYHEQLNGFHGTTGLYWEDEGRERIAIEVSNLKNPAALAAVLAHELGHVLLLGDKLITAETEDHEFLTDLLTVCLGMGVITSNAVIDEQTDNTALTTRWVHTRRGYLSMPMYGYALACFAETRNEANPAWENKLRPDVKWYFQNSVRFRANKNCTAVEQFNKEDVGRTYSMLSTTEDADDEMNDSANNEDPRDTKFSAVSMTAQDLLARYAGGRRDFRDHDLQGLSLNGAQLVGCNFSHCDMNGCNLENADLSRTNLSDAYLSEAILTRARLVESDLTGTSFRKADLRHANLERASIREADFRQANLEHADLTGCQYNRNSFFGDSNVDQAKLDASLKHHICGTMSSEAQLGVAIFSLAFVTVISRITHDAMNSAGFRWSFLSIFIAMACFAGMLTWLARQWTRSDLSFDIDRREK